MNRPNILFFLPDQFRPDWLGLNSEIPVRTPNLDRLAARGMRFTNAVCPSPLCAPSRACLASGKEYERCGVPGNDTDFPLEETTYYRILRDECGYRVLGVGKFDLHKASYIWGVDGKRHLHEWGFSDGIDNAGKIDAKLSGADLPRDPYMAYLQREGLRERHLADLASRKNYADTHPTPLPEEAYCDNWIARNGLELLRQTPIGEPWHLVVNFTGPHAPMDVTEEMADLYDGVEFPLPRVRPGDQKRPPGGFPAEVHQQIRRNYSAMVENIDRWIGVYLAEVEGRGELDNTWVVFSSDHGEMLGDRGRWGKGQPYQPSVGIPLIVAGPDVSRGHTSDALVSLIDLAATFVELGGAEVPDAMESRSLRPVLQRRTDRHRAVVRSALGGWRMVQSERYKLIVQSGVSELYDLAEDPWEEQNLASALPGVVTDLEGRLSVSSAD